MPELRQEDEVSPWMEERDLDSGFCSPKSNGKPSKKGDQRVTGSDLPFQRSLTHSLWGEEEEGS